MSRKASEGTIKLEGCIVVAGVDFRVAIEEDTENRQLILHINTLAEELEPRPLTKFLKLGTSDINGQVLVVRAKGKNLPDRQYYDRGGTVYV